MASIYEHRNYKLFVQAWLKSRPRKGFGEYARMASHLRTSSVAISQIFKGARDLSPEQALELSDFFAFSKGETEFFLLMVEASRAGSDRLRKHLMVKLDALALEALQVKTRLKVDRDLDEADRAIFYSSWEYSAVRLATSLDRYQSLDEIAQRFGLEPKRVRDILDFLVERSLVVRSGAKFEMGPASTHLPAGSAWVRHRQIDWRLKAIESMKTPKNDLFFTAPISISASDLVSVRQDILDLISRFAERVKQSPAEELACLNIDLFRI